MKKYNEWKEIVKGRKKEEYKEFEEEMRKRIEEEGLKESIIIMGEVKEVRVWYRRIKI